MYFSGGTAISAFLARIGRSTAEAFSGGHSWAERYKGSRGGKLNLLPCFQRSISFHVVVAKLNVPSIQDLQ